MRAWWERLLARRRAALVRYLDAFIRDLEPDIGVLPDDPEVWL